MRFSRKGDTNTRADNLSGTGSVYYSEWVDENNRFYAKIEELAGGYGVGNGTFSRDLYPLDEIGSGNNIIGYDSTSGAKKVTRDNNMSAFLRAIKADIEKRRESQIANNL